MDRNLDRFRTALDAASAPPRFLPDSFMSALLETHRDGLKNLLADAQSVNRPDEYPLIFEGSLTRTAYMVNSGWAVATRFSEDGSQVMRVYGPGDCFGLNLDRSPQQEHVTVLATGAPASFLQISANDFFDHHLTRTPVLYSYLIAQQHRLAEADEYARILTEPQGAVRLADLLLHLATRYGRPLPDRGGMLIMPPLRQIQLASWIGASRETVARALRHWRKNNLIRTGRRRIVVLDAVGLTDSRVYPNHPEYRAS